MVSVEGGREGLGSCCHLKVEGQKFTSKKSVREKKMWVSQKEALNLGQLGGKEKKGQVSQFLNEKMLEAGGQKFSK